MATTTKKSAKSKASDNEYEMSDDHKKALAEGRKAATTVRHYLEAVRAAKVKKGPGRHHTPETIRERLAKLNEELADGIKNPLTELQRTQEILDLETKLRELESQEDADPGQYESDFIDVAKTYGERKGITRKAWRSMGVDASVLDKAGVKK